MNKLVRVIECQRCGNWEEMPVDQPRHKTQGFYLLRYTEDEARYLCLDCNDEVDSTTIECEVEDERM
jgi:DNA-directed RNA polymerase subunit RPC12/RpoP